MVAFRPAKAVTSVSPQPLPEYDRPPVSEVVFSVEFVPPSNWRSAHAGCYWSTIKREYPIAQDAPALQSQIERFDGGQASVSIPQIQILSPGDARWWFVSSGGNRLIQIQRDRFITNWRKERDGDSYPRYVTGLRPRFVKEMTQFREFLHDNNLTPLTLRQCEISYINFIVRGTDWDSFSDAVELFSFISDKGSDGYLPPPESLAIAGSFRVPDEEARLHFNITRAIRQSDQQEGIQIMLTARGRPQSDSDADILRFMDLGREWIVRGFTDLTSKKAHLLWGRTQ